MFKHLSLLLICVSGLFSCASKMVCPAYQSAFILDEESKRKKFSYFLQDSSYYGSPESGDGKLMANPKILTASKDKYLIAVPESYRKKFRKMQTIEKKMVYPVNPDSLAGADSSMVLLAKDADNNLGRTDSVSTDKTDYDESGFVKKPVDFKLTKTKEQYNLDQDYYMWFLRKILVLPDIRYHIDLDKKKQNTVKASKKDASKSPAGDAPESESDKRRKDKPDPADAGKK